MAKVPESNWRIAPDAIEADGAGFEEPATVAPHPPVTSAIPGSSSSGSDSSEATSIGTIAVVVAVLGALVFGLGKVLGFF